MTITLEEYNRMSVDELRRLNIAEYGRVSGYDPVDEVYKPGRRYADKSDTEVTH